MTKRLEYIDIARALCVLWIVCVWHMNQYMPADIKLFPSGSYSRLIALVYTNGILALFTLISGYFMAKKKVSNTSSCFLFFKIRLFRFAIPLFVSCIFLNLLGFLSIIQTFTVCFGISEILPPPYPPTLWYFSMIILFYSITPLLLWLRSFSQIYVIVAVVFFYVLFIFGSKYSFVDIRLADNWPFYAIAFLFPSKIDILCFFEKRYHILVTLVLISIAAYLISKEVSLSSSLLTSTSVCIIILSISSIFSKLSILSKAFGFVSFASMFAYLFHREVYIIAQMVLSEFSYIEIILIITILFLVSYYLQKFYKQLSKSILTK